MVLLGMGDRSVRGEHSRVGFECVCAGVSWASGRKGRGIAGDGPLDMELECVVGIEWKMGETERSWHHNLQ